MPIPVSLMMTASTEGALGSDSFMLSRPPVTVVQLVFQWVSPTMRIVTLRE